tara:strand:+ start:550 stop:825 length:276 start_codon:yes stop_codon:yes gene_type:complete
MQWDDRKRYVKPFSQPPYRLKWGKLGWKLEGHRPKFPYSPDEIMNDWDNIDEGVLEDYYDKKAEYEAVRIVSFMMQVIQVTLVGGIIWLMI